MLDILLRAGGFVAIIILGYCLKKFGVFRDSDFTVLSKIVLKITLPASIFINFSNVKIDFSLLTLVFIGLFCGVIYTGLAFLFNIGKSKDSLAFDILNFPGYNIGCFSLPFIQSFVGPMGVITTSLFDTGNAFICLGGAYGLAASVKFGSGFSFKAIFKALFQSVPFCTYLIMLVLCLLEIPIPSQVIGVVQPIANANVFAAMFMIGVGFKLNASREQLGLILKIVLVRYSVACVFAGIFYFLLPFDIEIRKALVFLAFSPIGSAVPAFTSLIKGDAGLASAVNSICIVCSIILMSLLLSVLH